MSLFPVLLQHGATGLAVGSALYGAAILTAVLVALLARVPARRRDARKVLSLLLRRATAEERSASGAVARRRETPNPPFGR